MRAFIITAVLSVVAFGATAKTAVSPAFDGSYHAQLHAVPGMTNAECQPFMIAAITVAQGQFKSAPSAGAAVQGIVTQDGFVTGALLRPGKGRLDFEGRFVDKQFSGAVIDQATKCAWTITLQSTP